MIRIAYALEPQTFDKQVRKPGLRAVAELAGEAPDPPRKAGKAFKQVAASRDEIPAKKLPSYWTNCLDDMMRAYSRICAYSCFAIHEVTGARSVDHMAPKLNTGDEPDDDDRIALRAGGWSLAYEWSNYRLASSLLNARKNRFDDVLDPFEVEDGWFVLELVGFQVKPAPGLSPERQKQVEDTIDRLSLNDDVFCTRRQTDATNYEEKKINFAHLMEESPFVAREIERQGKRRPGPDVAQP